MHLAFDIFQGIGIAAAVGIRPFLPGLAAGGLAAGSVEIHFAHTNYSFLQRTWFLLVLVALAIALAAAEWRLSPDRLDRGAGRYAVGLAGLVLGALFFAGSLCRGHYAVWPGYVGGAICAGVAIAAAQPLFARVRKRLDASAAAAVPLYAEMIAVLVAALSILAPPVGPIALLLLLWLLLGRRRRDDQKYAGLRILR
ncbi:MAG: DUF4126 family protein [Solirubrobacteraceae bacterium]